MYQPDKRYIVLKKFSAYFDKKLGDFSIFFALFGNFPNNSYYHCLMKNSK